MIERLPEWLPIQTSQATVNIILLGVILTASIFADTIARRTRVPRISILMLVGIVIAVIHQVWLGQRDGDLLGGLTEP